MDPETLRRLRRRRAAIRARWETFLRLEAVTTPLANPDTLVFGLNRSLTEIFSTLRSAAAGECEDESTCECGRNPLLAYYRAGEQAVLEALVLVQAERAPLAAEVRDSELAEVKYAVTALARRDLSALARLCQQRHYVPGPRPS